VLISGVRGSEPPPTLKVGVSTLAGYRNAMTFVLCGLDLDAKAALVRGQLEDAVGKDGLEFVLARTSHPDADTEEAASALLHVHVTDADSRRAGRAFSQAAVELALASYPGFTLTGPPGDATPVGVFTAEWVAQSEVPHEAVLPSGERVSIAAPPRFAAFAAFAAEEGGPLTAYPVRGAPSSGTGAVRRVPLGTIVGARSGDKGGDANLGVWARNDDSHQWLREYLTVERLRELLPETATLTVDRYDLTNLRALNFVVHGLLGRGVAASTRFDPQAKALGEWLRSRLVYVPEELL
jgi:hypothetical protein